MRDYLQGRMRRPSSRTVAGAGIILLAAALALLPFPPWMVERYYSRGLYPPMQSFFTPITNLVPIAVIDVLIAALVVGLPAWWVARLKSAGRGRRRRAALALLFQTLVLAAAISVSFQLLWGFNYFRTPLFQKIDFDEERLNAENLKRLYRASVEGLNSASKHVHSSEWPREPEWRERLAESFNAVVSEMGERRGIPTAVPKTSLLNPYLSAAGIDGFTSPFGHEVILESSLLPFERPFVLAHEWAHLAGYADESEASFVGLIACLQSESPALRYSGWLALYMHTPSPAPRRGPGGDGPAAEALPSLAPEVMADLEAIRRRDLSRRVDFISDAQAKFYDGFLKANRVESGIASYGLLVRLVMGARFEPGWSPVMREDAR